MATIGIGFVYVLSNVAMPGYLKIGHTGLLADDRAKKLFTTGVPEPFTVELRLTTSSPHAVERAAHRLLGEFRHRRDREFFKMPVLEAVAGVRAAALDANGIGSYLDNKIHYIRSGDRRTGRLLAGQVLVVLRYPELFAREAEVIDIWQAHADGDYIELFGTNDSTAVAGLSDSDPDGDADPVPNLGRSDSAPNVAMNGRERLLPGDRLVWIDHSDGDVLPASTIFEITSYCQVVSRTYTPRFSEDGFPLLLNVLNADPSASMLEVARQALDLPRPRSWAPAQDRSPDQWTEIGGQSVGPEMWIPQLRQPRKQPRQARPPRT